MDERTHANWKRQRGFTLSEILVAVAIFTIIVVAALLLYDRSNKVFTKANEAAEMQQNTRVAFEKIVSEVRMVGFDYKRAGTPSSGTPTVWAANRDYSVGTLVTPPTPNGHVYRAKVSGTSGASEPAWETGDEDEFPDNSVTWQEAGAPVYEQPDEQIEYASPTALTIRANFDYDTAAAVTDNGRESDLENSTGGRFPVITTGNDEIVTYALKSADPDENDDTISFFADVNAGGTPSRRAFPGGAAEREIQITGVDLSNAHPPYTLMRYTLNADGTVQETALADNIRSMTFQYWEDSAATEPLTDLAGNPAPSIGGAGPYDPANAAAIVNERLIRGKIRSVTVTLTGMNPQVDPNYTHPTDVVAKNYRQYELKSTVVGRNLGVKGVQMTNTSAPRPPVVDSACHGYCGVVVLRWTPAPGTVDTSYAVVYATSETGGYAGSFSAGTQESYAVDLTQLPKQEYFFRVTATNAAGTSVSSNFIAVDTLNAAKPAAPSSFSASQSTPSVPIPNKVVLQWRAPTTSGAGTLGCEPNTATLPFQMVPAEIKGYRIYRSETSGFEIGDAGVVAIMDEDDSGATNDGFGNWTFEDTTAVNCVEYWYRIQTVEWCAFEDDDNTTGSASTGLSEPSPQQRGIASTSIQAAAPANLTVDPSSGCNPGLNQCTPIILHWDPVDRDTDGNVVTITNYVIRRAVKSGSGAFGPSEFAGEITDGSTTWSESSSPALQEHDPGTGARYTYQYSVAATYCGNEGAAATVTFPGACTTSATITPVALGGSGSTDDPYTDLESVIIEPNTNQPLTSVQVSVDGEAFRSLSEPYVFEWVDNGDGEKHAISFLLQTPSCSESVDMVVQNDVPACSVTGTIQSVTADKKLLDIFIKNNANEPLGITNFALTWAGQTSTGWSKITLPSGTDMTATFTAPATATSARTVTFAPAGTSDKSIAALGTYRIRVTLTGTNIVADATKFAPVNVTFTRASLGTEPTTCALSPLTPCSVRTTVATVAGNTMALDLSTANSSVEPLNLQSVAITWTAQNKHQWNSITLPDGTTLTATGTANQSRTVTFTLSNQSISTTTPYVVRMNFSPDGNNPPAAAITAVPSVIFTYSTDGSGDVLLTCFGR